MCNLFRMTADPAALAERFAASGPAQDRSSPACDILPGQQAWVVRKRGGRRLLDTMRWGFPPPPWGNAPVTTVRNFRSPFWRTALADPEQRCLVPATEFRCGDGPEDGTSARCFFLPRQPLASLAGLWTPVRGGAAMAILTCEPNFLVAANNGRTMPVLLSPDGEQDWLTGDLATAIKVARPYPPELMRIVRLPPAETGRTMDVPPLRQMR